ncbi:MAG: hypothetical protein ACRD63_03035 [Pyrinomonadaceae bacterium]
MAILKKLDQSTATRLLLEDANPVDLPPAEVDEAAVLLNFEKYRVYIPELLETLRSGSIATPVPIVQDTSTFAINTQTRTFWVKLWHSSEQLTRIERVQIISCLPHTPEVQLD